MKTKPQLLALFSFFAIGAISQVKEENSSITTKQLKASTTDHSVVINTKFVSCKSLSVEDVETSNDLKFQVLPNPVKGGYCEIKFPDNYQTVEVALVETSGKVIRKTKVSMDNPKIFVADLAKGLYLLKIKAGVQKAVFKIIKE